MVSRTESLLISYLENTISQEDEKLLIKWLKKHPESVKEIKDFKSLWLSAEITGASDENALKTEWDKLWRKIDSQKIRPEISKRKVFYSLPRIAAVFLLGAVISFAIAYRISNPTPYKSTFYEIDTPAGAKSKVVLPDGSTIWLNAGSNIKYAESFGKKGREVFLSGEAFFDVKSNQSKIFVVKTSELNIKAYGTTFNVKSYPGEGTIEATLIKGSIGVTRTRFDTKKNDEVILEPNQRVVYYRKTNTVIKNQENKEDQPLEQKSTRVEEKKLTYLISKGIDPKEFTSWKDGTLFISSETLEDLVVKLERKYDVKIYFENETLKHLKFTGSLENETVEQVIEAIGIAAKIDYKIEDREIWLKER